MHRIKFRQTLKILAVVLSVGLFVAGCNQKKPDVPAENAAAKTKRPGKKSEYVFALIAKSQSNPVFQAARVGAEDAAVEVGKKLGVKITILWRTPNEDDAQKQVENIEQLVLQGVDGISVSCSEANTLTPAINQAVDQGVSVMCFDSDAPASKRFCYHGTDDIECGHIIMRELAAQLGSGKHVVAIPGGNQNARNLQNRIKGALDEATNYPNITVRGVYYSKETPQDAAAKVEEVQTANPDIDGWAMIGSWSLFTDALLRWEPGKVKIVAMDALPAELPYLTKGVVQKLYAQQTYRWGWRSVELLADKTVLGKTPTNVLDFSSLPPVTKDDVAEYQEKWKQWLRQ